MCPLLEKYGTFIERCNALIEKVSPCITAAFALDGSETYEIRPSPAGRLSSCNGSLAWSDGRVELGWEADEAGFLTLHLDARAQPTHSTAWVGLPLPPGLKAESVAVLADGLLLSETGGGSASGLTLHGGESEGRVWITMHEPRSLMLALQLA
eukprot:SAG31_NODE_517_length_14689_cov_5.110487_11_plen_153_part_00